MARRPLKPCAWAACSVLVRGETYCDKHKPLAQQRDAERIKRTNQDYNERRDDSDALYKSYRWRKFSELFRKRIHCVNTVVNWEKRHKPSWLTIYFPIKPILNLRLHGRTCVPCVGPVITRLALRWV